MNAGDIIRNLVAMCGDRTEVMIRGALELRPDDPLPESLTAGQEGTLAWLEDCVSAVYRWQHDAFGALTPTFMADVSTWKVVDLLQDDDYVEWLDDLDAGMTWIMEDELDDLGNGQIEFDDRFVWLLSGERVFVMRQIQRGPEKFMGWLVVSA